MLPGFVEGHSVDMLQDVNAGGRLTNLKDGVGIVTEIGWGQPCYRRTIICKGVVNGFTVADLRADEEIEILRCSRFCVDANRVSADHQVINPVCVECD